MTAEHVWGDWIAKHAKDDADLNKVRLGHTILGQHGEPRSQSVSTRAGGPLRSTVPVVCAPCNSGWLSRIQNTSKSYLIPLIEGRRDQVIGPDAQTALATWATMATITGENILRSPTSIAVPQSDRNAFMDTAMPLDGWSIWIGHYRRLHWKVSWVHACIPIVATDVIRKPEPHAGIDQPNTQWTTMVVGNLYLHIVSSSTIQDVIQGWRWHTAPRAAGRLVQIWPNKESVIVWPPPSLTDQDAQTFATAQFEHLSLIGRLPGF
jgi:hypothetical protein